MKPKHLQTRQTRYKQLIEVLIRQIKGFSITSEKFQHHFMIIDIFCDKLGSNYFKHQIISTSPRYLKILYYSLEECHAKFLGIPHHLTQLHSSYDITNHSFDSNLKEFVSQIAGHGLSQSTSKRLHIKFQVILTSSSTSSFFFSRSISFMRRDHLEPWLSHQSYGSSYFISKEFHREF